MFADFGASDWKRVLIDVCTQYDYLDPGAILQVANRDQLLPKLRQVFEWAEAQAIPVVSIMESHRPTEPANGFPMHCIDGTHGQEKPPFTLIRPWMIVETDNYLCLPPDLSKHYRQLIFRKRTRDVLGNPKAERFLTSLDPEQFILFGVGVERAIKCLALGLLARHKRHVSVVMDACGYWSSADAELALRQLAAKHVSLVSVNEITAPAPPVKRQRRRRRRTWYQTSSPAGVQSVAQPDVAKR